MITSIVTVIILGEGFFNPVACDPDELCGSSSTRTDSNDSKMGLIDGSLNGEQFPSPRVSPHSQCDSNIQSCLPSLEPPMSMPIGVTH
ncbi:MAG: hypothetical protein HY538_02005 [Deltaproteobacteria bacterium]|nr:hypothetical protein [Deltaproteobacteria bacterium]